MADPEPLLKYTQYVGAIIIMVLFIVMMSNDLAYSSEISGKVKATYFIKEVAASIDRLSAKDYGTRELVAENPVRIEIYEQGGIACGIGLQSNCGLVIKGSVDGGDIGTTSIFGNVNLGDAGKIVLQNVRTVCLSKSTGKAVEVSEVCAG